MNDWGCGVGQAPERAKLFYLKPFTTQNNQASNFERQKNAKCDKWNGSVPQDLPKLTLSADQTERDKPETRGTIFLAFVVAAKEKSGSR